MKNDTSLSFEQLLAINGYGTLKFGEDLVFDDGVTLTTLRHAMQAAWAAREYVTVVQLAYHYKLHMTVCLRCVAAFRDPATRFATPPSTEEKSQYPRVQALEKLCANCYWDERAGMQARAMYNVR